MTYALDQKGEEFYPVFCNEHQKIGYKTLEEQGIEGCKVLEAFPKDDCFLNEDAPKPRKFNNRSNVIYEETIDDITSQKLTELIKNKKEQEVKKIHEMMTVRDSKEFENKKRGPKIKRDHKEISKIVHDYIQN